jgi:hypothetical protein
MCQALPFARRKFLQKVKGPARQLGPKEDVSLIARPVIADGQMGPLW